MANDNDVGHECPTYDTAGETPPRVPLLTPPQPSPTGGGGRTVEDWITVVVSRYRYLRNTQRLFPRKDSLPRGGGSGWGQQTNQRSFLKYPRQTHQETEIHEPTIGYERNAIYTNAARLRWGTPPAAGFALRGKEQFGANFDIHARTHPRNPAHLHTPERSKCM